MSDTIAAVATGAQVAAIGVVRLSGDGVIDIADKLLVSCKPDFAILASSCAL